VNPPGDKSVGAALVLTFLFGPFGLFYTSVAADIVVSVIGFVAIIATLGLAIIIIWPVSMVLGAVQASDQHSRYMQAMAQVRPPVPGPLNYDPRPGYRRPPPPPPPPDQPWA
jgi:hypothetical protein